MTKRIRIILISLLIVVGTLCIGLFAGCKINKSLEDIVNKNNLRARVTYFLNEGTFEDESQIKEMYFRENSVAFNIGGGHKLTNGNAALATYIGFDFVGWYQIKNNPETGNPLYSDNTEYVDGSEYDPTKGFQLEETPFDFSTLLKNGDHYYVCGIWHKTVRLNVKLVSDSSLKIGDKTYNNGDLLKEYPLTSDVQYPGAPGNATGNTFVSYYDDEECTKLTKWTVPAQETDRTIYAKYIAGRWNIVNNANDVKNIFQGTGLAGNHYIIGEDKIDCSGIEVVCPAAFAGTISGDKHHTISNLKMTPGGYLGNGAAASLFGSLTGNAKIEKVTFENLTLECNVSDGADPNIFFVFNDIAETTTITDVEIGGQLIINLGENSKCSLTTKPHWLFGGVASDSEYTGIKITSGTKCTITGQEPPYTVE